MKRLSVAISLALCVVLPASAQMYKWVDSNGKVQYSDKPPQSNIKTEKLRAPARAASTPAASEAKGGTPKDAAKAGPKTAAEQEQASASGSWTQQGPGRETRRTHATGKRTASAPRRPWQSAVRRAPTRIVEKGERAFLDDKQIAQETAKAQQEAAAACN